MRLCGCPPDRRDASKAGARVDSLSLGELAHRARAVLREESGAAAMLPAHVECRWRRPAAAGTGGGSRASPVMKSATWQGTAPEANIPGRISNSLRFCSLLFWCITGW